MKKTLSVFLFFSCFIAFSQTKPSYFQADYFYGNILNTNPDATVFLQGHPTGVFASYNIKTTGLKSWEGLYNYPDVGISFGYQDYKSDILGALYSIYGHYNFYLLNRIFFKIRKNKISHVGLYLGNNLFLHATTKAGVIVSDLDEEYYRRRYYGAGRDPKAPTCTPLYLPTTP